MKGARGANQGQKRSRKAITLQNQGNYQPTVSQPFNTPSPKHHYPNSSWTSIHPKFVFNLFDQLSDIIIDIQGVMRKLEAKSTMILPNCHPNSSIHCYHAPTYSDQTSIGRNKKMQIRVQLPSTCEGKEGHQQRHK